MAPPRKPLAAAIASGAFYKNPGRYKNRREPVDDRPIGEPPEWLSPAAQTAWRELVPDLPWLRYCHRGIVGLTAIQIAKMRTGELGIPGMNLLRQCFGKLGATPADFSRVGWTPEGGDEDDDEFFR